MHDPSKGPMWMASKITFSKKKAHRLHHPHTNALVITLIMENINMHKILINTGILADILFSKTWKAMKLTQLISLMTTSLVGYFEALMILKVYMTLPIIIG